MSERQEFPYHQCVAPMMWVIFALSLIEIGVVHFFVAFKWPMIGWPLTIVSALGTIWIFFWIKSFKKKPHQLAGERLTLRLGSLRSVELDLSNINRVSRGLEPGALQKKDITNLAGIAYPNRVIELIVPLAKGKSRIGVRLDAPEQFDEAMSQRGVAFE